MQHAQWLISARSMCELGVRTLRDEIEDHPEIGREPVVIEAHTSLVVALGALDAAAARPATGTLAEAQEACARAQQAVARARAAIHQLRAQRSERST